MQRMCKMIHITECADLKLPVGLKCYFWPDTPDSLKYLTLSKIKDTIKLCLDLAEQSTRV